jgi:hypothetical protein
MSSPSATPRTPPQPRRALPPAAMALSQGHAHQTLEDLLGVVETRLSALGNALRRRDIAGIDTHALALRDALQNALHGFGSAARHGPVPDALRTRLVQAGGQVAAQRETLARATFALDHAIDAMIPKDDPGVYGADRSLGPANGSPLGSRAGRYTA